MCDITSWGPALPVLLHCHYLCDVTHNDGVMWRTWCRIWVMAWLMYVCDMTHLHVWRDSFTCATWLIQMCDMTHSDVWHDSFIFMTWLIHMYDMTDSYAPLPFPLNFHSLCAINFYESPTHEHTSSLVYTIWHEFMDTGSRSCLPHFHYPRDLNSMSHELYTDLWVTKSIQVGSVRMTHVCDINSIHHELDVTSGQYITNSL